MQRTRAVASDPQKSPRRAMTRKFSHQPRIKFVAKAALLSVGCTALGFLSDIAQVRAQSSDASQLPPVEVSPPSEPKRRATGTSTSQRADRNAQRRRAQVARRPETQPAPKSFGESQDARSGTVGIYANSTSTATKTNTPLVNIPQSVSVVTKDFIRDQSFQSLTEVTRYVPGVAIHQGEGNRDELVIRGVDSSANFFVNGFPRRRPVFPRSLQRAEHRDPERTERADLWTRRRRRPRQPHAQGSRWHADL